MEGSRSGRRRGALAVATVALVAIAVAGGIAWWRAAASTSCGERIGGAPDAELAVAPPERIGDLADDAEAGADLGRLAPLPSSSLPAELRWATTTEHLVDVEVVDDLVVVQTDRQVVALDAVTGAERWRSSFDVRDARGVAVLGDRVVAYGREPEPEREADTVSRERLVLAAWSLDGRRRACTTLGVRRPRATDVTIAFAADGVALLDPAGRSVRLLDAQLEERWAVELPHRFALLGHGDGRVVVGTPLTPRDDPGAPLLLALDAATGEQSWTVTQADIDDLRVDTTTESASGPGSLLRPLAVGDGHVIASVSAFVDLEGSELPTRRLHHVAAFDTRTGERRWATPTAYTGPAEELSLAVVDAGTVTALRVYGGIGFDLASGTMLWDAEPDLESVVRDRPVPVPVDGGLIVGRPDGVAVLDPATGEVSPVVATSALGPVASAHDAGTLSIGLGALDAPTRFVATYELP